MLHHLMIGTWTRPGAIYTVAFDDVTLSLSLVKKTAIAHDEPISWMTFDVSDCVPPLCGLSIEYRIFDCSMQRKIYMEPR